MSFDILPVELYEAIFGFISPLEVPKTVLAVSRALPFSPIPLHHLYHNITIKRADQAVGLYTNLSRSQSKHDTGRSNLDIIASWINELSIEAWDVDAEVLINIFRLLIHSCPNFKPQSLNVWIGPRNFAPEHLEKLFIEPLPSLQYLSLRFRPYVQKATYQQFLKGVYFDSTLKAIGSWPSATLPALSIIQDPMDRTMDRPFAQPLVFFRLDIAAFMRSPALSAVKSLRFRIPARPVARNLCSAPIPQHASNDARLPDLKFLDLSTSGVLDADVDLLLVRLPLLEHLVLDGCTVSFAADLREGEWHEFGKRLALIGAQRARERERLLKEYDELRILSQAMTEMGAVASAGHEGKKVKPGRKGLATATISFRAPETRVPSSVPNPSAQVQTVEGNSSSMSALPGTPSARPSSVSTPNSAPVQPVSQPNTSSEATDKKKSDKGKAKAASKIKRSEQKEKKKKKKTAMKIRVLPSLPCLLSFSIKLSSSVVEDRHPLIRQEFGQGWAEGISQLEAIRARLRTSAMNGVRVMRLTAGPGQGQKKYSSSDSDGDSDAHSSQGSDASMKRSLKSVDRLRLGGLEDIDLTDPDAFGLNGDGVERATIPVPVLCFAGPGKQGQHADNCGHSIAWETMKDDH